MTARIFFATDAHGSERCFKKFLNAGKLYKANVVMLAGDISVLIRRIGRPVQIGI